MAELYYKAIRGLDNKLKQFRKDNKLTQAAMTKLVGCSIAQYRLWEWGMNKPRLNYMQKLQEVFKKGVEK